MPKSDERLWSSLHAMNAGTVEDHKGLAAMVEHNIAEGQAAMGQASTNAAAARERVARIKAGEDVQGGLTREVDFESILREAGWTTAEIKHLRLVSFVCDLGGHEALRKETHKSRERAYQAAPRAVLRKMCRDDPDLLRRMLNPADEAEAA